MGEKYFGPTFAIVTQSPDRHHSICQYSLCSRTSSHPQPSICRGEIFFARTSAIGGAQPPVCFCPTSFLARAKYFSPLRSPLLHRRQIAAPAAANHQYVRKPLRIPNHPFVGAKYFSPGRRPLVAPNHFCPATFVARAKYFSPLRSSSVAHNHLSISALHHLWHGRKVFCP